MLKRRTLSLLVCLLTCAALSGCSLFPNRAPVAAFVAHYNVVAGDPMVVDLDASTSTDPDGDAITQYMWAFSDDLTLVEPLAYSTVVDHPVLRVRCPNEGEFIVTLLVYDARAKSSEPLVAAITVPQPLP
jgi:hypothetical protein